MNMDELESIKKLIWMNIMFTWWIIGLNTIILLSIWLDNVLYQAISFLLVALAIYIKWERLDKKIRPLLKDE